MPLFGTGLGHASRMLLIADQLKSEGYGIHFSSFNEGRAYLLMKDYSCDTVPPLDVVWTKDSGPSVSLTLRMFPKMLTLFGKHIAIEANRIAKLKPKVVFSDSRLSSIIAARILGLPSLSLMNQIRILLPVEKNHKAVDFAEQMGAEILGFIWSLSDEILIPDLPPPYTICERNITRIKSVQGKIDHIGLLVPRRDIDDVRVSKVRRILELDDSKPVFFAQISGPIGTKDELIRNIIDVGRLSGESFSLVVSGGVPGGEIEPRRIGDNWFFEWCPFRDEIFSLADFAIIRGGHSTISNAISFGKPMLVLPIARHTEQIGNAERVEEIGLGLHIKAEDLSKTSLLSAMNAMASTDSYRSNASRVLGIASRYDALKRCSEKVSIMTGR